MPSDRRRHLSYMRHTNTCTKSETTKLLYWDIVPGLCYTYPNIRVKAIPNEEP